MNSKEFLYKFLLVFAAIFIADFIIVNIFNFNSWGNVYSILEKSFIIALSMVIGFSFRFAEIEKKIKRINKS